MRAPHRIYAVVSATSKEPVYCDDMLTTRRDAETVARWRNDENKTAGCEYGGCRDWRVVSYVREK